MLQASDYALCQIHPAIRRGRFIGQMERRGPIYRAHSDYVVKPHYRLAARLRIMEKSKIGTCIVYRSTLLTY